MSYLFRGGPLDDERHSRIHSLIVHMNGDGRHSIGAYIRAYKDEAKTVPLDHYEWEGELIPCERCECAIDGCSACNGTGYRNAA